MKTVKARRSNGSFAPALFKDEVDKKDVEDDEQIEVEDVDEKAAEARVSWNDDATQVHTYIVAWSCRERNTSDVAARCQFCFDCLACGRCYHSV